MMAMVAQTGHISRYFREVEQERGEKHLIVL